MKYLHNRLDRIEAALDRHQPDNTADCGRSASTTARQIPSYSMRPRRRDGKILRVDTKS